MPDVQLGVRFSDIFGPVLVSSGQDLTVFGALLEGAEVTANQNSFGIFGTQSSSGKLTLVVRSGDAAPGTEPGVEFSAFGVPQRNRNDQTVFLGRLRGPDINVSGSQGIFVDGREGGMQLIARQREDAPGTAAELDFLNFFSPAINSRGETSFRASLATDTFDVEQGIFSEGGGALDAIAITGEPAPEAGAGSTFLRLDDPLINARGQTVFNATVGGPSGSYAALYASDMEGNLRLIVREGGVLDISDDPTVQDIRTVTKFRFIGGASIPTGFQTGLNDLGQIAFAAELSGGTGGVFVSNLVATVPEPNSCICFAFASAAGLSSRWRLASMIR